MFDANKVREDFPVLKREVRGKPLVYLDSAATSQKPVQVIRALTDYYENYNSNIHRGIHTLSEEATAAYEDARKKAADFIGASSTEEVIFTRNTTESINLVMYAWGRKYLKEGDEILLTLMEHHSDIVPWIILSREKKIKIKYIPVTEDGHLDLSALSMLITHRTKLVCVTHMSNVFGTINPVREIVDAAHRVGALCLVDGAQSVPHLAVNMKDMGCDFFAFSAHKMLGPTGVGVLYGRRDLLAVMEPFQGGGDMISQVFLHEARWNELPWRFEAGTPNIADVIAFGAALDYLTGLGMDAVRAHEKNLTSYALDKLKQIKDILIYGPDDARKRGGVISFNLADVHPHDVGTLMDEEGVAIRAGHHCCQPLMQHLGVTGPARASFYVYNTAEEVDALCRAIVKVQEVFKGAGVV